MKQNFNTTLINSFMLWLNNKLDKDGEAYSVVSSSFFKQEDPQRAQFNVYASPYKGFVYDSCAVTPISGVYTSSGNFLTRDSGVIIDFNNGRILSTADWGQTLSGTYYRKEYNVYFTSDEESEMFLENNTDSNKDIKFTETGVAPYAYAAPCIFVTCANNKREPFAFGGTDNNKTDMRLFVISNNNYSQETLNGLLIDSTRQTIPILGNEKSPFTFYGDLKSGYYNYCESRNGCETGAYIRDVYHYKIGNTKDTNTLLLSAYDFSLETIRNTRS